jgi:hypothetical protein
MKNESFLLKVCEKLIQYIEILKAKEQGRIYTDVLIT